jgi:hypothetical protein
MGRRTRDTVTVACANCGGQDAIQIEITLPDDTEVRSTPAIAASIAGGSRAAA